MRHDKAILGPGYFTREDILDFYGDVEGATRWERAKVYDSDDSSSDSSSCPDSELSDEGSDDDVDDAGG